MRVRALDHIDHPDFHDVVVHFTGRTGPSSRPSAIQKLSDWDRLKAIIGTTRLRGHEMPGAKASAVCFTEATSRGCSWLINEGRYTSCGVAFTKRFLFSAGGGPVLQVRGDEWEVVTSWPERLRARAVRLWPGASPAVGETLPWWLAGRSEWLFEREWRVPTSDGPLRFDLDDIAFLVLPSVEHLRSWVAAEGDRALAGRLAAMRYVVIGDSGIEASNGVRQRRSTTSLESTGMGAER